MYSTRIGRCKIARSNIRVVVLAVCHFAAALSGACLAYYSFGEQINVEACPPTHVMPASGYLHASEWPNDRCVEVCLAMKASASYLSAFEVHCMWCLLDPHTACGAIGVQSLIGGGAVHSKCGAPPTQQRLVEQAPRQAKGKRRGRRRGCGQAVEGPDGAAGVQG